MKEAVTTTNQPDLHLLLADDDEDDRSFFKRVVDRLLVPVTLTMVEDGDELLTYLFKNVKKLPDVLFLDINMPKKNGAECLLEIKHNKKLEHLPVIIYSTAIPSGQENKLYDDGAHYYIRKTNLAGIEKVLLHVISQLRKKKFVQLTRDKFILS
jgi:CheY-like chemotaxis protein